MTRIIGILLIALIGLSSVPGYAIPAPESADSELKSEVHQFKKHLNLCFPGLNLKIKDNKASASEILEDLEALEDFLHGDQSVVGPLKRIACDKCVCTGC